jgi:hypothetical protein
MPSPRARTRGRTRRHYRPRRRSQIRFRYQEQFGVIVICRDEADQRRLYHRLSRQGLACKVVTV